MGYRSRREIRRSSFADPGRSIRVLVGTHCFRKTLNGILALAGSSSISVQGLYLPPVPLEVIRRLAPHVLRSDHTPFWEAGIPALMWTDPAEFRNPNYHRPPDTPKMLDDEFMAGVAKWLIHAALSSIQRTP